MQLKRDTDIELRIVHCVMNTEDNKMSIAQICRKLKCPRVIVERLCSRLEEGSILISRETAGVKEYSVSTLLEKMTLLDFLNHAEGHKDVFSVFDHKSEMFLERGYIFESINKQMNSYMSDISLKTVLETSQKR